MGTELRPIPRLSKAHTSIPLPASSMVASSLGVSVPVNPLICGPHESCVPASPGKLKPVNDPQKDINLKEERMGVTYNEKNLCRSTAVRPVKQLDITVEFLIVLNRNLAIRHVISIEMKNTAKMDSFDSFVRRSSLTKKYLAGIRGRS